MPLVPGPAKAPARYANGCTAGGPSKKATTFTGKSHTRRVEQSRSTAQTTFARAFRLDLTGIPANKLSGATSKPSAIRRIVTMVRFNCPASTF